MWDRLNIPENADEVDSTETRVFAGVCVYMYTSRFVW